MTAVLETARFQLQPISLRNPDHRALYVFLHTDPTVMRYILPPLSHCRAEKAFERICRATVGVHPGHRYWIIVDRISAHACGIAGFRRDRDGAEIGVMLSGHWWRRSVATEVLSTLLEHGRGPMRLTCVFAEAQEANAGVMHRLFTRLGFEAAPGRASASGLVRWERSFVADEGGWGPTSIAGDSA